MMQVTMRKIKSRMFTVDPDGRRANAPATSAQTRPHTSPTSVMTTPMTAIGFAQFAHYSKSSANRAKAQA